MMSDHSYQSRTFLQTSLRIKTSIAAAYIQENFPKGKKFNALHIYFCIPAVLQCCTHTVMHSYHYTCDWCTTISFTSVTNVMHNSVNGLLQYSNDHTSPVEKMERVKMGNRVKQKRNCSSCKL